MQKSANASFEFQCILHTYSNINHTLGTASDVRCCDGSNSPDNCVSNCDNKFVFCLRNFSAITQDVGGTCTFGMISTRPDNSDMITFQMGDGVFQLSPSSQISSATNPLVFNGGTWPVSDCYCLLSLPIIIACSS